VFVVLVIFLFTQSKKRSPSSLWTYYVLLDAAKYFFFLQTQKTSEKLALLGVNELIN
jgi:hypothetical protein